MMLLLGAIHLLSPPQLYFKPLSGERNFKHLEMLEFKRKVGRQKTNHMGIIFGLCCTKM